MAEHDWPALETAFARGNYNSLRAFAQAKSINYKLLLKEAKLRPGFQRKKKPAAGAAQTRQPAGRKTRIEKVWGNLLSSLEEMTELSGDMAEEITPRKLYELANALERVQKSFNQTQAEDSGAHTIADAMDALARRISK